MYYVVKRPYWLVLKNFRNTAVQLREVKELVDNYQLEKDEKEIINYLVRKRLAYRVVKDIYFICDPLEREPPAWKIIAAGLNKAGAKWYFGLYSAWMNGRVVQQVYLGEVVVNNEYSGKRTINGVDVLFVKTKREELFTFGVDEIKKGVYMSNPEKMVLDFIYFGNFGRATTLMIEEVIDSYFDPDNSLMAVKGRNYERLKEYLNYYPDFVRAELYGYLRRMKDYFYYSPKVEEVLAL